MQNINKLDFSYRTPLLVLIIACFAFTATDLLSQSCGMKYHLSCEGDSLSFSQQELKTALENQGVLLLTDEVNKIFSSAKTAHKDYCSTNTQGGGQRINSKVRFAAVNIARSVGLNPEKDRTITERIAKSIAALPCRPQCPQHRCYPPLSQSWNTYFQDTINLNHNSDFLQLVGKRGFSPVKISWEDIGRYEGSAWGDRISDVGIWVRKDENRPDSAQLALSVRRDSNFRDKVLVVPSEKIKIHTQRGGRLTEISLPDRLRELDLSSKDRDETVIVSNQFAIVPVPSADMQTSTLHREKTPPRAAFNFSIFPYGSTNFVITDVIEGSHEAIVGSGGHQLLFANVNGEKAPFTASRAADRPDLLKLETELKSQGMDVDVQRYYLIQIPLKRNVSNITLSNMGNPPSMRYKTGSNLMLGSSADGAYEAAPSLAKKQAESVSRGGLEKVAIGTGAVEGKYFTGSGFRNQRAEEPIRVTVVYFVTPRGIVNEADMETFAQAFEKWDEQAIWGGSFVVPEKVG